MCCPCFLSHSPFDFSYAKKFSFYVCIQIMSLFLLYLDFFFYFLFFLYLDFEPYVKLYPPQGSIKTQGTRCPSIFRKSLKQHIGFLYIYFYVNMFLKN